MTERASSLDPARNGAAASPSTPTSQPAGDRPAADRSGDRGPGREHPLEHSHDSSPGHSPGHSHGHSHGHAHVHSAESLRRIVNRLSRIEGHIRGVKVMVQESRPCPDVLIQLAAVRGAIDRVSRAILDEHLSECVARAAREGDIDTEIAELKAALDRFLP